MLQAHSFLWHYLWITPNVLLLSLGVLLLWSKDLHRRFPAFSAFAVLGGAAQLALYSADVAPSVSAPRFWHIYWGCLLLDALLKIAVFAEIFSWLCNSYPAVARLGRSLIRGVAVCLIFAAVGAAAYAQRDNPSWLISGAHLLEQTIFVIECGLLLFLFLFAGYFHLRWVRKSFGIAFGFAISASVQLATWAVMANTGISVRGRTLLDFLNMATYHVCVLIWFYYLLSPDKSSSRTVARLPEHNLEVLNHELERLLQR
ncbi:MAG TPA: hypothetical protein VMU61_08120 [Candidatus Aquilonibacter sp.]|nr:hypothetical protein [Candidatus Aquilonibacter sp.]